LAPSRPATPGRRAERRAATRDAIVAGTLSLLADGGGAAASMHDVARRAGVATGSLYRHFASRDELLAEVLREAAAHDLAAARDAARAAGAPAERVVAAVAAFARRALAAPPLARALAVEPLGPQAEAVRAQARTAQRDLLAELLAAPPAQPAVDPELAAQGLVGALHEVLWGPGAPRRADDDAVAGLTALARALAGPAAG
jgi:AcrR family transcriptional regulator